MNDFTKMIKIDMACSKENTMIMFEACYILDYTYVQTSTGFIYIYNVSIKEFIDEVNSSLSGFKKDAIIDTINDFGEDVIGRMSLSFYIEHNVI